ncbi:MAG: phage baseplate protein [Gammaproteobacteria bacterium]|nr:phage baseplate protein [Gammaproteobacteria bacterium]
MRALTAAELLNAWEVGLQQPPILRALSLLACACPELTDDDLWTLSIGQRDARLLELRRRLFGSELAIVIACPVCAGQLESSMQIEDLQRAPSETAETLQVCTVESHRVTFHLPTSRDLVAVANDATLPSARAALLRQCIADVRDANGDGVDAGSLSTSANTSIAEQMAMLDLQADIQLEMTCPACQHRWSTALDIANFLWKEIQAWATRTLRDVARLARAYGWSESETLALSPTRRQIYLELCRQ